LFFPFPFLLCPIPRDGAGLGRPATPQDQ
jgi:hypothetical protein